MIITLIVIFTFFLTCQSVFSLIWMLYAWEDPDYVDQMKSPKAFSPPAYSFTALIPARSEEKVIGDTIKALHQITYPEHLKETIVLCRYDDEKTIAKVKETISEITATLRRNQQSNIRLLTFGGLPINKPHSLNIGLKEATKDIIVVFDAEDQPHKDIYHIANTLFLQKNIHVLQSGVQLMNYNSKWFSLLNVLEYFFWFKSGLHFFSRIGVSPLGGNSVFINRQLLHRINGWKESCLTEDAEIGFRLVANGGKIGVVYDEAHTTLEETPLRVVDFIKQRTRWNQGFLQVFSYGHWLHVTTFKQKILSCYVLLAPTFQSLLMLYIPFTFWTVFTQKLPVIISLFSFLPFYLFLLQLIVNMIGFYEFSKAYHERFSFWALLIIFFTFYPYQLLLTFSSLRALIRIIFHYTSWEKTAHENAHRSVQLPSMRLQYA